MSASPFKKYSIHWVFEEHFLSLALSVPASLSLSSLCLVNVIFEFLSIERGEGAYLICHSLHAHILSYENCTL